MLSLWHVVKHVIQWKLLWHKHECETCCETECETCCETCSLNARHVVKLNARIQWKLLCHKHDVSIVLSRNLTWSRAVDCYISSLCSHSMETVTAETRREHCVWQKYGIAHVQWTLCVVFLLAFSGNCYGRHTTLLTRHTTLLTRHSCFWINKVQISNSNFKFDCYTAIIELFHLNAKAIIWLFGFDCKSNRLVVWIWLQPFDCLDLIAKAIILKFGFDCKCLFSTENATSPKPTKSR